VGQLFLASQNHEDLPELVAQTTDPTLAALAGRATLQGWQHPLRTCAELAAQRPYSTRFRCAPSLKISAQRPIHTLGRCASASQSVRNIWQAAADVAQNSRVFQEITDWVMKRNTRRR